ncbi:NUDIX hydrolase [Jiulongibacter sp. NS-SX5]|uniref:NUDIX hydrolase n=1 Tax=Jiulongibacter sp. NS-SX5 TaxID=3463854 RepID=UPI004059F872
MIIFINDRPLKFVEQKKFDKRDAARFHTVVQRPKKAKGITEWVKKVLITEASNTYLIDFFKSIKEIKKFDFKSATFVVDSIPEAYAAFSKQYKIVDAAGGVILNDEGQLLMIYRRKKWDLPKGKADKGETMIETAEREVEEECGITVKVEDDYFVSYHTYTHKNERVLKRTFWYKMELVSDEHMQPQIEEDIEDIRWMNRSQMHEALKNSFPSIEQVIDEMICQKLSFRVD